MTPDAYCHRCGNSLQIAAQYCNKCGTQCVDDPDARSTAPPPPEADQPLAGSDPYGTTPPPPQAATLPPSAGTPPVYAAQAPPQSQPSRPHRAWLVVAGTAGVLLIVAVVLVLALLSSGGIGVHAATVLTVTTPATPASPDSTSPTASSPSPSSPPASTSASSPSQLVVARVVPYEGARISASIPAGWAIDENEVQKPGYIESKWTNPADTADYLLIDESPATKNLTLEQDASSVHQALQESSGYQQISGSPGVIVGEVRGMFVGVGV